MESSSAVFVVAATCAADPAEALLLAIKEAGVKPGRVQDFILSTDNLVLPTIDELAREILVNCPLVTVSSSMRGLFFAAQSILCEDADLILLGGGESGQFAALLLASPVAVGVHNLTPLARIDARSLTGTEYLLKKTDLAIEDVDIKLEGDCGVLLAVQLVEQLQESPAIWGLMQVGKAALLIEKI